MKLKISIGLQVSSFTSYRFKWGAGAVAANKGWTACRAGRHVGGHRRPHQVNPAPLYLYLTSTDIYQPLHFYIRNEWFRKCCCHIFGLYLPNAYLVFVVTDMLTSISGTRRRKLTLNKTPACVLTCTPSSIPLHGSSLVLLMKLHLTDCLKENIWTHHSINTLTHTYSVLHHWLMSKDPVKRTSNGTWGITAFMSTVELVHFSPPLDMINYGIFQRIRGILLT